MTGDGEVHPSYTRPPWFPAGLPYTCVMVRNTEAILIEALQLPLQERIALASRLLASLDEKVDEGVDEAWGEEVKKRLDDIDSGRVEMVPWETVRKEMRGIVDGSPD